MKVININSGLGNQMLAYCVVLSIQKENPTDTCYIETIIYDIPECNKVISQWYGYELEKIFNVKTPNVKSLFTEEQWQGIINEVKASEFWDKKWNYAPNLCNALNHAGLHLINKKGDYLDPNSITYKETYSLIRQWKIKFLFKTSLGAHLRYWYNKKHEEKLKNIRAYPERLFLKTDEDIFTGMWLEFMYRGNHIEKIHDDILKTFVFPPFDTEKNIEFAKFLDSCNSVFIHARRGDSLQANSYCYKYGYFQRAVRYIKKHIDHPVFVFFTNTGSIEWCKENSRIFGLDYSKDQVYFVDWNIGEDSFRDMQLMTHCKHGIITNSSFGWWGAYLIQNPNKITISPSLEINTTHHF